MYIYIYLFILILLEWKQKILSLESNVGVSLDWDHRFCGWWKSLTKITTTWKKGGGVSCKLNVFVITNNYIKIIFCLFLSTLSLFGQYVEPMAAYMHCWLSAIALFAFFYKASSAEKDHSVKKREELWFVQPQWLRAPYSIISTFFGFHLLYYPQSNPKREKASATHMQKPYYPRFDLMDLWI